MDNIHYNNLINYIKDHISIDGTLYKEKPFQRRINLRMKYTQTENYVKYLHYLKNHPEELEKLKDSLTINVTRFFRNRETFYFLEEYIRSRLKIYRNEPFNILSVGCSSGEEAYTMAIIMENLIQIKRNINYKIMGVDFDKTCIENAKAGRYNRFSFVEMREAEIEKYFYKISDLYFIKDELKRNVEFKIMDVKNSFLLKKLGTFDLIICRNVLIYFSKDFQDSIVTTFHEMLKENGILVLGKIEILTSKTKEKFNIIEKKERVYSKIDNKNKNR